MSDRAPYSRVYWTVIDDPKFDGIYDDDAAFALWMRLLMNADAIWPAPAALPRTIKSRALAKLVEAGIVDLLPKDRYRIHGLDAERGRRRDAARTPPKREPDGTQTGGKRLPDGSPARARASARLVLSSLGSAPARDEPHIEAWLQVKFRLPTERQRAFLDRYLQVFDVTGPQRMARIILEHSDDPIAALKADLDRHREERLTELSNGHAPEPRPKPKREPWQNLLRDKLAADEEALQERTRLPGVPS